MQDDFYTTGERVRCGADEHTPKYVAHLATQPLALAQLHLPVLVVVGSTACFASWLPANTARALPLKYRALHLKCGDCRSAVIAEVR